MNIIKLENIGKKYILKYEKGAFIKDVLPRLFIPKEKKEFWALREINLTLKKGESLGIIGRNGAGKSTLLNIIAGISSPTDGKIKINGRLSTLLTLGAGFHPELTGEDNIYLNGAILGLKIKEIKNKLDEIIEFSELKDFIKQPLYTYSSGMILRLGFSIAVHINFDILLIDEIISVGDLPFQEKCIEKITTFVKEGKTLIIASQSLELIKTFCHRALLLEKGKALLSGEPEKVISKYLELIQEKTVQAIKESQYSYYPKYPEDLEKIKPGWGQRFGTEEAKILEVKLKGSRREEKDIFQAGESLRVEVKYKVEKEIKDPHFGVAIFRDDYIYCYGPNTRFDGIRIKKLKPGEGKFSIIFKKLILGQGDYRISVAIWDKEEKNPYDYHYAYYKFQVIADTQARISLIEVPCYLFVNGKRVRKTMPNFLYDKERISTENFIEIAHWKSRGRWGREKTKFSLNESLKFLFSIKILEQIKSPYLRFKIFTPNDLLIHESCFAIAENISPIPVDMVLGYPNIPLLRGNYNLSLGIGSSRTNKFQYLNHICAFEFHTFKKDHGLTYLPHRWILRNP